MEKIYTILDMPQQERPRERLMKYGPEALSTQELLAVILGRGSRGRPVLQIAQELLAAFGTGDALLGASIEELCQVKGLGQAKAVQLKAVFALAARCAPEVSVHVPVRTPQQAFHLLKEHYAGKTRELFIAILLNARSCFIGTEVIAIGTLDSVPAHPREIFHPAIRRKAASLILAHNHPSGDPAPSKQDLELTRTLVDAGHLLGIPVRDHIIIAKERYCSLREQGFHF